MNKSRPIFIFLAVRAMLFLSLPFEGVIGYGDLVHFFDGVKLEGWPFLDYWMEFPPIFPFLAESLYRLVGEGEPAFIYLLAIIFTVVQAANIYLFMRIATELRPGALEQRTWTYVALLAGLFYGWTYFDPLVIFALLLGMLMLVTDKPVRASAALAFGALVKWFPLMGIPALLRTPQKKRLQALIISIALIIFVWGGLAIVSPEFTAASLRSQYAKGSWETVWALVDGNLSTGNFGAKEERFDPDTASIRQGNAPRISPGLSLIPFALLGGWVFLKSRLDSPRSQLAFTAFTLVLFFLWSPGWSPQWTLYLLPFILLLLRSRIMPLMGTVFVLVNLLEWPLLLSRGMFWGLYITVPIRTFLLLLLAWEFWLMIPRGKIQLMPTESS